MKTNVGRDQRGGKVSDQVGERKPYSEDDECFLCGFTDLDGLWYDGTCDICHDRVLEVSIKNAIVNLEKEEEK